ncbi:MAG: ATP-binding protein [Gammaproteobacteria bacterium]|nr:ATP-binding protein [Gammaproteobacteria bacterium]
MRRDIEFELMRWKDQKMPMPLLLRGARQVGKTYIIEKFGQEHFEKIVTINFELQPEMTRCFEKLEPTEILNTIFLLTQQKIVPQKTLLFLDEIQDCPNAIRALRYFKEKLPQQHVIAAGSLLEFTLNDAGFSMPVGRVQSLYLKPLSFKEYLVARGDAPLRKLIESIDLSIPIEEVVHERLLKLVREYMVLGGMPATLQYYFDNRDLSGFQYIQNGLLNTYRQDFGKYAKKSEYQYLQKLFEKIPGLVGENFKYSRVDPDMRSRDIKDALYMLKNAGLIYSVYATAASGLPLASLVNEKKFKILFLDVGLMTRVGKLESEVLLNENIFLVNRGVLSEQFVGQELLAYMPHFEEGSLYFWLREKKSSMAEVDFVSTVGANIIPIEVKAGTTGTLKSLKLFIEEKNIKFGVRISQQPLSYIDKVLSMPLYMVGEIARMVTPLIRI